MRERIRDVWGKAGAKEEPHSRTVESDGKRARRGGEGRRRHPCGMEGWCGVEESLRLVVARGGAEGDDGEMGGCKPGR